MPSAGALRGLGLGSREATLQPPTAEEPSNPFASLIPWLTSMSASGTQPEKPEARYLVAKGLPTLPTKLVEKVWNLEYVEMEELLPTPRALRIAEQGNPSHSLQDPGWSTEPVSGYTTTEIPASGDGYHDMGALLYALHGGALGQGATEDTEYGGPPPHGTPPSAAVIPPPSVAGIRHPVQNGDGCLRRQGMDVRRPVAIHGMPPQPASPE